MTIRIKAAANFNQDTFENSGDFIEDDKDVLELDLRSCVFADIYSLVTTLTIASLWCLDDRPVRMRLPKSKSARTYMARMRFFDTLPDEVQLDGERPTVTEHESALVPLTRLDPDVGEFGIEELCQFAYPQLPPQLAEHFTSALAEVGSNVVHHSEALVGFVAGQRFEKGFQGRPPPRLHLVVADAGIGIRSSLAQAHPEVADMSDVQAISKALEWGVTSKPDKHSGVGLSTVQDYARAFAGVLRIRSGTGTVVFRRGNQHVRGVPGLPGTIVSVELCSPGRR